MLETKNSSDRFSVSKESGGALKFNNRSQDSKKVFEKRFFNTPPPKKKTLQWRLRKKKSKTNRCVFLFALIVFRRRKADACSLLSGVTKNQSAESPLVPDAQSHRPSLVLYQCHHFNQFLHDYLLEQELCSLVASW